MKKFKTLTQLTPQLDPDNCVLFLDRKLLQMPSFRKWIKQFPFTISLTAGETLKSLDAFVPVLKKMHLLAKKNNLGKDFQIVGAGGGSVTDFVGFLSSVYQRGHPLILIPSTWLCAVDSAFGGKNGLNLEGDKNQIGSIYQPSSVYLVQELLLNQPRERTIDGFSESIKIGIIRDPQLFRDLEMDVQSVLKNLDRAIRGKLAIVKQDPFETQGIRYLLNFGHTFGHVFETSLNISHGVAVLFGQICAIHISHDLGHCHPRDAKIALEKLLTAVRAAQLEDVLIQSLIIPISKLNASIRRDKKFKSGKMNFVFFNKIGLCSIAKIDVKKLLLSYQKIAKNGKMLDVSL